MIGKGTVDGKKTPDVYSKVENYMIEDIRRIKNTHTEIIIIPFQEKALTDHIIMASNSTEESKDEVIAKIRNTGPACMKLPHDRTNISQPLLWAKEKHQKPNRINKLLLLTDGRQNMNGGMEELKRVVDGWAEKAHENDFLIYVMTTENAPRPTVEEYNNIINVGPEKFVEAPTIFLLKPGDAVFNIKDNENFNIKFNYNNDVALPTGAKIRVQSSNTPINIDETVILSNNGTISITPKFDYNMLKTQIGETEMMTLNFSVENYEELLKGQNKIVRIIPAYSNIKLINKKERVLTISVVEE